MKTVETELEKAAAEYRAAGASVRPQAWNPRRRISRPWTAAVATAALVLMLGLPALLLLPSDEERGVVNDGQPTFSGVLGSIVDLLPDEFDLERATPLLALEGNPEEVATHYLDTRIATVEPGVTQVEEQGGYTLVQWAWGRLLDPDSGGGDRGQTGWLVLRPILRGYEVVAATTDGVDLSDVTLRDGVVSGAIEGSSGELIAADVLNLDGSPVDSALHPDGFSPDSMNRWGTSGASSPPLVIEISVTEPVVVRVTQVGGTLLSVSEVVLGSETLDSEGETQRVEQLAGQPLTDQQFDAVFGTEDAVDIIRESAFLIHARDQDAPNLGFFGLYGARATSADGIEFDRPVECIFQHGMDEGLSGHQCGPDVTLDLPGISLTNSCADPGVTMISAWAINPEVEEYELAFSDGSSMLLEPTRGYLIWAWRNTKQLTDIRAENASTEVQDAVDDAVSRLPHVPCE